MLGKSGSGKSTVENYLTKAGYSKIVTYTTRQPRDKEVDGVNYNFVTANEFRNLINSNKLTEWAEYADNLYGTPRIEEGNHVVVIEPNGYITFKALYGKSIIGVYLKLKDELQEGRIKNRAFMSDEELLSRKVSDRIFEGIEKEVDLVLDASETTEKIASDILEYVKNRDNQ